MIGLSINELRVKVKGHISHDQQKVSLTSKPDGSIFILKSPTYNTANQYSEQFSIYAYGMTPWLRTEMLDAEQKQEEVEIDGPIFEPERSPPLILIVEHAKHKPK